MATVSVVPPGGLAALQFSEVAPGRSTQLIWGAVLPVCLTIKGKTGFLGLDWWKKSGCKLLVWCGCFFQGRVKGGKVGQLGWKERGGVCAGGSWAQAHGLILTHNNTHTLVCLWGPGYVKVMADGALGRRHCDGASCWLFFHVIEEISSCQWPMTGSKQVQTENQKEIRWKRPADILTAEEKKKAHLFQAERDFSHLRREQHPSSNYLILFGRCLGRHSYYVMLSPLPCLYIPSGKRWGACAGLKPTQISM